MDKISYLRLFQIYSDTIVSNSLLGSKLRQVINLDVIWNELSDDEKAEMKKIFIEIVNKIAREILTKKSKSYRAFKRGMRKK